MILFDSSELWMPTPRKLHTALAELEGRQACVSPTVASELAPDGYRYDLIDGVSPAEHALGAARGGLDSEDRKAYERNAWWAQMWRDPESPYRLVQLTPDQSRLAQDIARAFDQSCFTVPATHSLAQHRDAQIVAEALATSSKLLLTSNMRTIDHENTNDWAESFGDRLGFTPQRVVASADATLLAWAKDPEREDGLLQSALMACWPAVDSTPGVIVHTAAVTLQAMAGDGGGRLPGIAMQLSERLRDHPDPDDLVRRTRENLPSLTIETDLEHPAHPGRGPDRWSGVRQPSSNTKSWQR